MTRPKLWMDEAAKDGVYVLCSHSGYRVQLLLPHMHNSGATGADWAKTPGRQVACESERRAPINR
jgi:hypothetical protein